MRIEHVAAWCGDLEKTRNFFEKYFQARSNEKYVNSKGFESYFLTFDDGARLELMHMADKEDLGLYNQRLGFVHLAFALGSKELVDELTQKLKDDGYTVLSGPRTTGDGYYESCIQAEDNLIIELTV
ncbi:MAG: VOC family protein [Succinivibrio sp.]